MIPLSSSFDLIRNSINLAIRNKIGQNDLNIKFKDTYLANRYFFSKKEKLNKIYGLNKIRKKAWIKKLKIFSSVGEKLSRTTNHTNRIGSFYCSS